MKDFIKRNSPVFAIGVFTAVIFLVITIAAQFREAPSPKLIPVTENQMQELDATKDSTLPVPEEIDTKYGPLEITYTVEGFTPKNTKAYQNQLVRWTNNTDTSLTIVPVAKTHKNFPTEVEIKAGETFEYRLTNPKLWSYQEKDNSLNFWTIFVLED
jgi:hypothetical protein